jgi:hypothetical protein
MTTKNDGYDLPGVLQTCNTSALLDAALGRVEVLDMIRAELANRGVGLTGEWVGFPKAHALWENQASEPTAKVRA